MGKKLMGFEICGKKYELSQYDEAIQENKDSLNDSLSFLEQFPYSVRQLKDGPLDRIKGLPVFIITDNQKISLYEFIKGNREFENSLSRMTEINSLEQKYELLVLCKQLEKKDQFHAIIIETFRVLQDLSYSFNTARFALLQGYRILHFRSGLVWSTGWEQLWSRSVWLNNAIIMYNSCYDKLLQSIWIGFELFVGYQKKDKNGNPRGEQLNTQMLNSLEGLKFVCKLCTQNSIKHQMKVKKGFPYKLTEQIERIYNDDFKTVRSYANTIKHQSGMRYRDLFPYGQVIDIANENEYSSIRTQYANDMDDVIEHLVNFNNAFHELTMQVFAFIMKHFETRGYLEQE